LNFGCISLNFGFVSFDSSFVTLAGSKGAWVFCLVEVIIILTPSLMFCPASGPPVKFFPRQIKLKPPRSSFVFVATWARKSSPEDWLSIVRSKGSCPLKPIGLIDTVNYILIIR